MDLLNHLIDRLNSRGEVPEPAEPPKPPAPPENPQGLTELLPLPTPPPRGRDAEPRRSLNEPGAPDIAA